MARHWFGAGLPDWTFTQADGVDGVDGLAQLVGDATVTFWNLATGGTQYTDLLVDAAAADHVLSADGTGDAPLGSLPAFQGPEDVWLMWADAGGGSRHVIAAWDVGTYVAALIEQANSTAAALAAHIGATNPHAMPLGALSDVQVGGATTGQVLTLDATGDWVPSSVDGVTGVVTVTGEQTITGTKIFQHTGGTSADNPAVELPAQSGQVSDLLVAYNASGQRTGYFNEHGEIRVIAGQANTVPVRIKQRDGTQTGDLTQWADVGNNPLAVVDAVGRIHGVNTMHTPWLMSVSGDQVQVGQGVARIYNDTALALTIRSVRATAGVPPTGDDLIVDINKNGTTILTTELVVADGEHTSGRITALAVTSIGPGEYLTMDVDQLGSTEPGDHIVVQLQVS